MKCIICQKERSKEEIKFIDEKPHCTTCLYQKHSPFLIYPIGVVENQLQRSHNFHLKGNRHNLSKIILFDSMIPFMYKLSEEKRIDVLYYLHKQKPSVRSQFPRGLDGKTVGVFASRTPDRLTPIAITNVKLEKIENNILFVRGLDAIDGSPVLDIKLGMNSYR